jgi:hypothetical protein
MAAAPPSLPLTVTEKMLRNYLYGRGITHFSDDLTEVCKALNVMETQRLMPLNTRAIALSRAFNKWKNGNHPGELSVLENSPELKGIESFVAAYPVAAPRLAPLPVDASASGLKSIGVALYSVTNMKYNFTLQLHERLRHMRNAVGFFNNWLEGQPKGRLQDDNPFLGIFIAPEYYFSKPNAKGEREFLDLPSKNMLDVQLKQLSKAFPKILLIPGTIHYEAEMTTVDKVKAGEQLLLATSDRIFREEAHYRANPKSSVPALANPKLILDYSMDKTLDGYGPECSDAPSANRLAGVLLNPKAKPRWVHNVTSLLLNGNAWGTYDKHTDFFEAKSISPDRSMFVPGTRDQCPVIGDGVRGFRFGVEICFDHANGVLKNLNPGNLAFHIVVSDCVENETGHMAMRNSGYFLHASTAFASNSVWRCENGNPVDLTNKVTWKNGRLGPNHLGMVLIELPVPWTAPAAPVRAPDARRWG